MLRSLKTSARRVVPTTLSSRNLLHTYTKPNTFTKPVASSSVTSATPVCTKPTRQTATITSLHEIPAVGPAIDPALLSGDFTLHSLLNPDQKDILRRIKNLISQTILDLRTLGLTKTDIVYLRNAIDSLDELFLVVVVGEFNSGKSNFINALLGAKHCKTGVLPTTETVQILRYGEQREERVLGNNLRTITVPIPWLRQANLVDTPGTNAVLQEHQEITEKFIPNADMILFVTSVERPFSESEKQFLSRIHQWKKKVVIVLNKVDLVVPDIESQGIGELSLDTLTSYANLQTKEDGSVDPNSNLAQIIEFVKNNSAKVLGEVPKIFGVSSKLALEGKVTVSSVHNNSSKLSPASLAAQTANGNALIANSGFLDLENYMLSQLTAENKIHVKMTNPLSLLDQLVTHYEDFLDKRSVHLEIDQETRMLLQREIDEFTKEVTYDFEQQLTKIDNIFLRMKQASSNFIAKQVKLSNISKLTLKQDSLQQEYVQSVHTGVSNEIDDTIRVLSSWLLSKTARQAHSLATIISRSNPQNITLPSINLNTQNMVTPLFPHSSSEREFDDILTPTTAETADVSTSSGPNGPTNLLEQSIINIMNEAEQIRAVGVDFQQERLTMIQELHNQCKSIVSEDKRIQQTQEMVKSIHKSVIATAAMETAALSLGAVFTAAIFDITGIAAAGGVAALGLFVLPSQRARITRDMNNKIDEIHATLRETLKEQYTKEIQAARQTLTSSLNTFDVYVTREEQKIAEVRAKIDRIREESHTLRKTIGNI